MYHKCDASNAVNISMTCVIEYLVFWLYNCIYLFSTCSCMCDGNKKCFPICGTFIVLPSWQQLAFLFFSLQTHAYTHLFSVVQIELPIAQSYLCTADLALASHINPSPLLWPSNLRACNHHSTKCGSLESLPTASPRLGICSLHY